MRYWLIRTSIHGTDIQQRCVGIPWPYDPIQPNNCLRAGDIAYLSKNHGEIYSWGYVSKIEPYTDQRLEREVLRVTINRPVLRDEIISAGKLRQHSLLARFFSNTQDNLIELTAADAKAVNQLLRSEGVESPPDPAEDDAPTEPPLGRRTIPERTFVLGKPVGMEENLYVEFKQFIGQNPVASITNIVTEYAVAFLNSEGGSIFWGIQDDGVVGGVQLNYKQRDEIRRYVSDQLSRIQPYFPISEVKLDFHAVCDEGGQGIIDLWVFEVTIPKGMPTALYATDDGKFYLRIAGSTRRLRPSDLAIEIMHRKGKVKDKGASSPLTELSNQPPSQIIRIFLCHSSGDKPGVRNLYSRLRDDGFHPWLDEEDLLPGQDWEREIPKAVRASDVVIVCLSKGSVTKAGFVQKELKFALDVADEKPEGTIFIIPLRLEECEVPERLRRWHWVDLFDERGYEKLLRSLQR